MSWFLDQAQNVWEVAGQAANAGTPDATHTILIDAENGIRVVSGSDWPIESLQALHGARTAYRVTHAAGRVQVEGKSGARSCVLIEETGAALVERARRMLIDHPAYLVNCSTSTVCNASRNTGNRPSIAP